MRAPHATLALLAALVAVPAGPAFAAPPAKAPRAYVVSYQVKNDYQGKPEDLWEIATRFLGDADRAGEILALNTSRVQPDGERLSDPGNLHAGWKLILPWDATGTGLKFGEPPAAGKASADAATAGCAEAKPVASSASWGQTLLAPAKAWPVANGAGIRIAVIGSGTDAASKALAGRVAVGADIATGTGRGDSDCTGTGTAIAGIVAGDDGAGGKHFGVAPGATVVPIRVAATSKAQAVTAIQVAASSGVQVIAVGAGVDTADTSVRAAIDKAIAHDIVVVVPASTTAQAAADGLLRVGGVTSDHKPESSYPAGSLDLVAPGVQVATIGRAATGTEYAAAFVAGTVALFRSAHPTLRAADVTKQLIRTASSPGQYGAGLVDPYAAATTPVSATAATAAKDTGLSGLLRTLLWVLIGIVVLAAVGLLLLVGVRRLRSLRQARAARQAQLAAERNDPFWQPPAEGELPQPDELRTRVD